MIALGCDHAGYELKHSIMERLSKDGIEFQDLGTYSKQSMDYPDIAFDVANAVAEGGYEFGILICGTGIGVSISANKVPGIRAALCSEPVSARLTKEHNDANIICLGARIIGDEMAWAILQAYMQAKFSGGKHSVRIGKISKGESRQV